MLRFVISPPHCLSKCFIVGILQFFPEVKTGWGGGEDILYGLKKKKKKVVSCSEERRKKKRERKK